MRQERIQHAKQVDEHRQTIASLQEKVNNVTKQHGKTMNDMKHEFQQEHSTKLKHSTVRPTSLSELVRAALLLAFLFLSNENFILSFNYFRLIH